MRIAKALTAVTLTLLILAALATPAAAGGTVTFENRSGYALKVAGEGGSGRVDEAGEPVTIAFDGGKDVGIDVKIWWVSKPRELCQLFVPWERTVVVSGTTFIKCRSE